jgi:hypothetical protein
MKKKPEIIHILANGVRVETIKGHKIPAESAVYEIVLKGATGK